jgi:hypothetical protein
MRYFEQLIKNNSKWAIGLIRRGSELSVALLKTQQNFICCRQNEKKN